MYWVEIDTCLKAQQSGVVLSVGVGKISFLYLLVQSMSKDLIVYTVGKQCQLCRDITRGVIHSQVGLQAILCFKVLLS